MDLYLYKPLVTT